MIGALGLALAGVVAIAQQNGGNPGGAPPAEGKPAGDGDRQPPKFGTMLKETVDKYDTNKDGQLDKNEMAAFQKDVDEGKLRPPMPQGGMGGGRRGFGGPPGGGFENENGPGRPGGGEPGDMPPGGGPRRGFNGPPRGGMEGGGMMPPPPFPPMQRPMMGGPGGPGGQMGGRGGGPGGRMEGRGGGRDGEGMQGGGRPGGRGDRGGQGGPALSPKQIMEKFDTDKDGKLSETELEAFLKAGRNRHQGPPPGDDDEGGQRNGPPPQNKDKDK